MATLQKAIDLFHRGNLEAAAAACMDRLNLLGTDVDAWSLLAEIHTASSRHEAAAAALERVVALRPDDPAVRRRLAGTLLTLGQADAAASGFQIAIRLDPGNARGHNNLGQALMRLRRLPEAMSSYREALRLNPDYVIAYNNLGLAHTEAGEYDLAIDCFRRALELDPALIVAEVNLGAALDRNDRPTESLRAYDRAVTAAPQTVDAWVGRGAVLAKLGRFELAVAAFDRALKLRPHAASVQIQRAFALLAIDRATDALAAADAALRLESSAEAHNARAGALRRLGRRPEALASLERALALDPGYADAWSNQGTVLHEMGETQAAIASCRRAIELQPNGIQARTRLLARLIPSVPRSIDEATAARDEFDTHLLELRRWLEAGSLSERDALTVAQQQIFYLSYQERSNRALLEDYRGAAARQLAKFEGFHDTRGHKARAQTQRFRLGFISAHVHDHSVFQAILRGWLHRLDRRRFDIALFSLGTRRDAMTQAASESVEHFDSGTRSIRDWASAIQARQLDAVIYPEIGMHEPTLGLASLQLADRQFAAWGHPETSGLPTIDGYLSAELFEPEDAEAHYSEKLVRLPNLGVYCEPYGLPADVVNLEGLGIERNGPVFICPGVPFKYQPQDDWIFVEIAHRLGRCNFVFFQYEIAELSRKFQERVAAAFECAHLDPRRYLRFIPWQPREAFFGLLRQADVYLDTLGFSGFNTLIQAVECNLPCVTYAGRFMRGRLGSGILKRLELTDCVAADTRRYVDVAVELAAKHDYNAHIRAAMRQNLSRLYGDMDAVDALSDFLLAHGT